MGLGKNILQTGLFWVEACELGEAQTKTYMVEIVCSYENINEHCD